MNPCKWQMSFEEKLQVRGDERNHIQAPILHVNIWSTPSSPILGGIKVLSES